MVKIRKIFNKIIKSRKKMRKKRNFTRKDYNSGEGMLTSVWGPSMWHYLHTMSFNYPVKPTRQQKKDYKKFVLSLRNVLPCKWCRINLRKNLKVHPLRQCDLKNRYKFSKWMYGLHEHVNKMLQKKSGLSYCDVRERYENFRSRCTKEEVKNKIVKIKLNKTRKIRKKGKGEDGCTEPFHGKKSKCVIKIVPTETKIPSFQMDKKCKKVKIN